MGGKLGFYCTQSECFHLFKPHPLIKSKSMFWMDHTLAVAKVGGVRGEMDWEVGFIRCKLLYKEQISNKVLLYTENYIPYPMISHNGK